MPYKRLIKIYTERQNKLLDLMKNKSVGLKNERLNSIHGAVDEIGLFLNVLNQYQEHAQNNIAEQRRLQITKSTTPFVRLKNSVLGYLF